MIKNFITQYGFHIIATSLTAAISYIGIQLKIIIKELYQHKIKKEEAEIVCHGINNIYPNYSNNQKINEAIISLEEILKEKNIQTTDLEAKMLVAGTFNNIEKVNYKNICS